VWRHKFLLFFGFFAWGSSNSFGGWNANFGSSGVEDRDNASETSVDISNWIQDHLGLILAVAFLLLAFAILLWLWSVVCRGAVIATVNDIREGSAVGFRAALRRGLSSFRRLLILDLFLFAVFAGTLIILGAIVTLMVFLIVSGGAGQAIAAIFGVLGALAIFSVLIMGFGYLTCFTIWFAISVPVSLVLTYAMRFVVLEGSRPIDSLRRGWRLMMDDLSRSLLLFGLGFGLGLAGGVVTVIAVLVSAIPAAALWITTGMGGWPLSGILVASLLSLLPLAVGLIAIAVVNTFMATFWTVIFRKLTGQEP
jgi:hypothetical protein